MRKNAAFIIATLFSVLLISCSKKDVVAIPNNLVSTSWTLRRDKGGFVTLKIIDKEKARLTEGAGSDIFSEISGTYVYNKPDVSLKFPGDDFVLNGEGKVEGNTLQLTLFIDDNKMELTLIKD